MHGGYSPPGGVPEELSSLEPAVSLPESGSVVDPSVPVPVSVPVSSGPVSAEPPELLLPSADTSVGSVIVIGSVLGFVPDSDPDSEPSPVPSSTPLVSAGHASKPQHRQVNDPNPSRVMVKARSEE